MNGNIAEYHVPVNTNIHDIDVIFVDEPDEIVNPLGLKCLVKSALSGSQPDQPGGYPAIDTTAPAQRLRSRRIRG